jgi:beta-barrel assembly-enhancing protease
MMIKRKMINKMGKYRFFRHLVLAFAFILIWIWHTPVQAISIKEEEKLAREFMKYIVRQYELINDPTIVGYVESVGRKILAAMPPQPFDYHFYVLKEDVYNAFAIPAGHIFINSGLLAAMENEDELAGILGHEIAHVVNRHISKRIDRSKKINLATMAGMVAGIFLGATTGDPAALQALTIGSAAAGQTASLAYSREDEAQADQFGLQYIRKAGYDTAGLLSMLKKIRSKQWFGTQQIPTYMMTHPALEDRLVWVDAWSNPNQKGQPPKKKDSPRAKAAFNKINIRLKALHGEADIALQEFRNALKKNPKNNDMLYGYGLALARVGKQNEAVTYIQKALAQNALDPFMLTDLGRIYYKDGRYKEAYNTLEGALSITADNPEGLFYFGRTQVELDQLDEAAKTFNTLISKYKGYTEAYYALGEAYGRLKELPNAHYYLGIYYFKKAEYRTAHFHLVRAKGIVQDPGKREVIEKTLESIGPLPKEPPT